MGNIGVELHPVGDGSIFAVSLVVDGHHKSGVVCRTRDDADALWARASDALNNSGGRGIETVEAIFEEMKKPRRHP